jgi:hypothetical protein
MHNDNEVCQILAKHYANKRMNDLAIHEKRFVRLLIMKGYLEQINAEGVIGASVTKVKELVWPDDFLVTHRLVEICKLSAQYFCNKDYHRLTEQQRLIVNKLVDHKFLTTSNKNGFVGDYIPERTNAPVKLEEDRINEQSIGRDISY